MHSRKLAIFRRGLCILLLSPVAFVHGWAKARVPRRPDVFLVTIDTLRADHIHAYGDSQIQTPALDGLARDGIIFLWAFTPSPITNSAHASIFTGLLPSAHGVTAFRVPLSPVHATMAELLKEKGYETAGFIASRVLDTNTTIPGLDRGFDFYDNFPEGSAATLAADGLRRNGRDVVRRAEAWLNIHRTKPQFVWVHLYDVHAPYSPTPPYSLAYKGRPYDAVVAYADSVLGEFLVYLRNRHLYDDSIVIVVADHGEGLGEHGEDSHGVFLYDSTTHVPLIIKLPGRNKAGAAVSAQVRTTDILPTLLQLLGMPLPVKLNGESLVSDWSQSDVREHPVAAETDYPLSFGWAPLRSARANGYELIEAPRPEFYDLRVDPEEIKNIYEPWDPHVEDLRQIIGDANARPTNSGVPAGGVKPDTIDELQALGYWMRGETPGDTKAPVPSLLPDPKDKVEELRLLEAAGTFISEGQIEDGRHALEHALQIDPASPSLLSRLGPLELSAGERRRGNEYIELANDIKNDNADAAYRMAVARQSDGDNLAAKEALEVSVSLASDSFSSHLLLGKICLGLDQPREAEVQFQTALLLDVGSFEAELDLAQSEIASGDYEEAIRRLGTLAAANPTDSVISALLSQAHSAIRSKGGSAGVPGQK